MKTGLEGKRVIVSQGSVKYEGELVAFENGSLSLRDVTTTSEVLYDGIWYKSIHKIEAVILCDVKGVQTPSISIEDTQKIASK